MGQQRVEERLLQAVHGLKTAAKSLSPFWVLDIKPSVMLGQGQIYTGAEHLHLYLT